MKTDLRVTLFACRGAEAWVRHAYNVPPGIGLSWTPYRVLVTSNGGTLAHRAFLTVAEFKRWMRRFGYRLVLQPHHRGQGRRAWVARFGSLHRAVS